jgi:hypothetical protein
MQMRTRIIVLVFSYIIILTIITAGLYYLLVSTDPSVKDEFVKPVMYADDEKRYSRPYRYLTSISSSEIETVEDLYSPKSFGDDNITIYFPEDEEYGYRIGVGPEFTGGSLIIYRSNGTEVSTTFAGGGGIGSSYGDGFREAGHLTLSFSGSGVILFYPVSIGQIFDVSSDQSGRVHGPVAFPVPWVPPEEPIEERRIVAQVVSDEGKHYRIRFYCELLRFITEVEGNGKTETQIPSGMSGLNFAVVESEGNVTLRFYFSKPLFGELGALGWALGIVYAGLLIIGVCFVVHSEINQDKQITVPIKNIHKK